ncbi:MAG TPA: hypothetical protein PK906_15750, partial [Spirochaetota bacterium]|nr:hypothetical protein [Spirochaetota bacterium]
MKKFKSHLRIVILCAASFALLTLSLPVSGEYKFREFGDDHSRFERYSDEAENKLTVEEWQSILDSGREEMRASWEKGADEEVRRYLLEGGDESEIRGDLEEARAEWERDFDAGESAAKGAWYLKREMLTSPVIDLLNLKERVTEANSDDSIETIEAWDAYVEGELHSVNSEWSEELNALLDGARLKGAALTGKEREGFERELALYEESLNSAFSLERDSVLYLARNKFITEKFTDTGSLRRISEAESAAAITESVIDEVESDIEKEEDRILTRSFSGDGSESIDFSALGDDWEEELKKLIETGMSKWNSAREKLYNEMLSWKNSAQEAFDNIEAKWRLALEKLEKAKAEWEEKLRGEIYNGLAHWFKSEEELDQNIDTARNDLDSYMENLSSHWSDHSSNLVEMAVNGSKVYSEALDNIKWLEEMCAKSEYANRGAFGLRGEKRNSTAEFDSILSADEKERISEKLNSLPGFDTLQQRYFLPYAFYQTGRMAFRSCHTVEHETTCHENIMNSYLGRSYYNSGGYYTYEYLGAEEYKDEKGNWGLRERYEVRVYGKKVTYQAKYVNSRYRDYGWYESDAVVDSFEITNEVKSDYTDSETGESVKGSENFEKSTYFYYKTELERWKSIRDSFSEIADDAEFYMHEMNMLGENKGAGYLTPDSESENDPYLMTGAELDYELASRDREFWERRLEIARAVRDYAYPENGERESAEKTLERKEAAKSAMESAKAEYENALEQVKTITDELKKIQGVRPGEGTPGDGSDEWNEYEKSIENLSRLYSDAGEKLKATADELEARRKALIIVENGRDSSYIAEEIEEIERNILAADRELREKRSEYYSLLRENERAGSAADFAALYSSAARGMEEAKDRLALVTGGESDENLVLWCENIASSRALVWGEGSAADENAEDLLELAGKFNSATGEEREDLRKEISSCIKSLYISFMTEYGIMKGIFAKLGSREFDPGEYLDSEFSGNNVYAGYAAHSINALNIIDAAFDHVEDSGGEKSYEAVASYLQGLMGGMSYVYGSDNTVYMEHYAALNILNDRYRGLTPEAWEGSRDLLDDEIDAAEEIVDLYSDRSGFDISECESDAATGDSLSIILMREYYSPGSEMAGFLYMEEISGEAAIGITAEENIRGYVEENYSIFYKVRETVEETDYLTGMLGYINMYTAFISVVDEGVTLSVDDLKSLAPEQMSVAAGAASEYIDDLDKNSVPVPLYMRKMVQELLSMKSGLDASLFIADYMEGRFTKTADEIYASAEIEKGIHDSVADYLAYADEIINSGTMGLIDLAEDLCSKYSSLSEDVRKYITEHGSEDVSNIAELVSSIESALKGRVTALTDYNYIINDAGILPSDYADINGITGDAKTEFIQRLDPFYYRGSFDSWFADGGTGGVEAFISSKNLTGETAESVRIYALVKSYMDITESGSYDSADPALNGYVTERRLQDYIASHGRDDGEEDEDYIERIVSAFVIENGGDGDALRDYMEGFLSGELTAAGALPDEVKLFAARDFYYRSVHLAGGTLSDDDIEELLRERFGEDSLDSDIIDRVFQYAAGLRAYLLYSGQGFDEYRGRLDDYAEGIFTTACYYGEAALLPMFDSGVYGNLYIAEAGVALAEGAISDAVYDFSVKMGIAYNGVNEDLKVSEANFANAQALHDFTVSGAGGSCWRDYILPANIEVRDSEGNVTEVLVSHETYDETGSFYDEIDPETGERTGVKFDPDKIVMQGKDFSRSVVIDKANSMHDLFAALFAGAEFSASYAVGGTGDFLREVEGIYSTGTDYSLGSGGLYSYETDLMNVVSKYSVLADDYASQVFDLESAISGLTGSVSGLTESLKSSRDSYELMGGDKGDLLVLYEEARVAHESVRAEYEKLGNDLTDAQQFYSERNSDYIEQMNRVSSLYSVYQGAEFDYDRAYQVWEYANTPYLKNESISDSGLSGGESVTGGTEDYGDIPVPDAMDVYNRIEARFNEADAEFKRLEEAKNNQETVEKLNQDGEYLRLKNELVNISGTYVRSAQVDAELEEKISQYENDYTNALNSYTGTKGSLNIFADMLAKIESDTEMGSSEKEDQISELELIRDTILSHINTETERKNFINGLAWYSCKVTWESYYTAYKNDPSPDYKSDKKYKYRKKYADRYDALPEQIRADIELLYEKFGGGDALTKILASYDNYVYSKQMKDYCEHKYHSTSKYRVSTRRKWRNRRNNYRGEKNRYYGKFYSYYNSAGKTSVTLLENKTALINASGIYSSATSVRYLSDIKEYLGGEAEKYNLMKEDLDHLYDAMSEGYVPDENSLNIEALRREKQRTDIDGLAVKAKIVNGRVVLLDKDGTELKLRDKDGNVLKDSEGNELTENYAKDDNSIILKDSEG